MSTRTMKRLIEIVKKSKDFSRAEKSEILGLILKEINTQLMEGEK